MYQAQAELRLNNVVKVTQDGIDVLSRGDADFDLSSLTLFDSSAVAAMLAWQRAAQNAGKILRFHHVPASLHSLVKLYGLTESFCFVEMPAQT